MEKTCIAALIILYVSCIYVDAYASCDTNTVCSSTYGHENPPIVISTDSYPEIHIMVYAPDFNSNPYAIDTIGEDGSTISVSTNAASIRYILAETGPDTGYFSGYVTLSSTTSSCLPVCGPTDGFLAAGDNDGITVSFTYANGHTVSASSDNRMYTRVNHGEVPEFPLAMPELFACVIFMVFLSKTCLCKSRTFGCT